MVLVSQQCNNSFAGFAARAGSFLIGARLVLEAAGRSGASRAHLQECEDARALEAGGVAGQILDQVK